MRTAKVLVGSVVAIAAALQIGMAATASADAKEWVRVDGVTAAEDGMTLDVEVTYNCTSKEHKKLTVTVEEQAKEAKVGEEAAEPPSGAAQVKVTETVEGEEKSKCDGKDQKVTVTVKDSAGEKWSKPGMGTVSAGFVDAATFKSDYHLKWVGAE
ncbi:hypothetical protein [Nocardia sp. NPDC052316]|uniref:hypothetical protein n=1 Tax=Nocardia sp. NPDC052316 TaxID=3364329 RepID=UPI0037C7ECA8